MTRSRAWCYTLNNPTEEDIASLQAYKTKYHVYTLEHADEGTPHIQGYFEFKSAKQFSTLHRKFPTAHFEQRKGTAYEAASYCWKETGEPDYEKGERPEESKSGPSDRYEQVRESVASGQSKRQLIDNGASLQQLNYYDQIRDVLEPERSVKPIVHWFYGPSGSGKTTAALNECSDYDYYCAPPNPKWWPGYDRHTHVIVDELRDQWSITFLLRLLDVLPLKVEIKGGHVTMVAEHIFITTLYSPEEFMHRYYSGEPSQQLLRRIDDLREYNPDHSYTAVPAAPVGEETSPY